MVIILQMCTKYFFVLTMRVIRDVLWYNHASPAFRLRNISKLNGLKMCYLCRTISKIYLLNNNDVYFVVSFMCQQRAYLPIFPWIVHLGPDFEREAPCGLPVTDTIRIKANTKVIFILYPKWCIVILEPKLRCLFNQSKF